MVVPRSFRPADSTIRHEQNTVRAIMDKEDLGLGTLYVTESFLSWQGANSFSLAYPNISLHAVSSDVSIHPTQCLYVLIDGKVDPPGTDRFRDSVESNEDNGANGEEKSDEDGDDDDNDDGEESNGGVTQLILVPDDVSQLHAIYEAIKDCQALHPDPNDVSSDDEMFQDADDDCSYFIEGADTEASGDAAIDRLADRIQYCIGTNNGQNSTGNQDWEDDEFKDAD